MKVATVLYIVSTENGYVAMNGHNLQGWTLLEYKCQ
jgi:hypothetical protein